MTLVKAQMHACEISSRNPGGWVLRYSTPTKVPGHTIVLLYMSVVYGVLIASDAKLLINSLIKNIL